MHNVIQRIPYSQKIKDDNRWAKENIDSIIDYGDNNWGVNRHNWEKNSRYNAMYRCYKLYNNEVEQEDFDADFNPMGIDIGQKKDLIMPYNKIHNKVNVLIGELIKRPFNVRAYLAGAEGAEALEGTKEELIQQAIMAELQMQIMANKIKGSNMLDEQKQQAFAQLQEQFAGIIPLDKIDEYLSSEYLEPREIIANKLLDIVQKEQKIPEKRRDSFKHALISDEEHAWVGVENGKVCVHLLNPLGVFYHKSPDVKYIQYGDFAGYRTRMTISDILDTFRDLDKEDLTKLSERYKLTGDWNRSAGKEMNYNYKHIELNYYDNIHNYEIGQYGYTFGDELEVVHVEWRSQKKVGILTFVDKEGMPQSEFVAEDYKVNKKDPSFIDLEWIWLPEIWEGVRIDNDIYTNIRPVGYQLLDPDNPYTQPLRYHGVVYTNMNARSISTVERMRPFQMLYYIIMHKLKKRLSRDQGKKFAIDVTRLPKEMDLEQVIYYMEQTDYYFYSSLEGSDQPGASQRPGIDNAIDMSSLNDVLGYIQILDYIDMQIGEVAGVTRPREGQTTAYEAVTNAQQSILQSSNITEILFNSHYLHWENILDTCVNLMLRVYNEKGFLSQVVGDSLKRSFISLDPNSLPLNKFNIYVSDSARENDIFNQLKGLAQPLLQNDKAKFSDIIKLIKATSIEELNRDIMKIEAAFDERMAQMQQSEMQSNEKMEQMRMQLEERRMAHEKEMKIMDVEGKIMVAKINSMSRQEDQDIDDNGVRDQLELAKLDLDAAKFTAELDFKKEELAQEKELAEKELEAKKEIEAKKAAAARSKAASSARKSSK